jgi:hypothetical protein
MSIYSYKNTQPKAVKQDDGVIRRKGWIIEGCFVDFRHPMTREEAVAAFESDRAIIDEMRARLNEKTQTADKGE